MKEKAGGLREWLPPPQLPGDWTGLSGGKPDLRSSSRNAAGTIGLQLGASVTTGNGKEGKHCGLRAWNECCDGVGTTPVPGSPSPGANAQRTGEVLLATSRCDNEVDCGGVPLGNGSNPLNTPPLPGETRASIAARRQRQYRGSPPGIRGHDNQSSGRVSRTFDCR